MSARLDLVYEHIKNARKGLGAGRVVDVGSDHGLTAISCLESNVATSAVCTDINEGPAKICRANLDCAGYKDKAAVVVTDGLDGVKLEANDIIVISGLGGLNTIDILKRTFSKTDLPDKKTLALVLQPQKTIEELRLFLRDEGFAITDETAVKDQGFHYVVMTFVFAGDVDMKELSDIEYAYLGPVLREKYISGDPDAVEHYEYLIRTLQDRARSNDECREAVECILRLKEKTTI